MKKKKFFVPVEIEVEAETAEEAEREVVQLVENAFEVSNDLGIFISHRLHETSDTIEVGNT